MAGKPPGSPCAVIFDVDGTLIDSVDFHARAWVDAFAAYGHSVAFDKVRREIGKGGDQLMPVFLSREEIEQTGKALESHRGNLLKERYLPQFRAFPKVRELVQRVLADGIRVALGSSAKTDELAEYKKIAGIEGLVDTETSSDDAEHSKPNPDIFEAAIAKLGITDPARILVVGDTPYDAQAALKAGLRTIGLRCGGAGPKKSCAPRAASRCLRIRPSFWPVTTLRPWRVFRVLLSMPEGNPDDPRSQVLSELRPIAGARV